MADITQKLPSTAPPTGCDVTDDARFIFFIPSHLDLDLSTVYCTATVIVIVGCLVLFSQMFRHACPVYGILERFGPERTKSVGPFQQFPLPREHKQASSSSFIAVEALKAGAEVLNALSFLFRMTELHIGPFHRPLFN